MPVPLTQIAKFIAHMWTRSYSHSTIVSAMSVLAFVHKIRNYADPTDAFLVKKLLLAVKKTVKPGKKRRPITQQLLVVLVEMLELMGKSRWDTVLLKAVMLILYTAGLRVGELLCTGKKSEHTPRIDAVYVMQSQGYIEAIVLRLDSWKHSGGEIAWIKFTRKDDIRVCPVTAFLEYYQMRGEQPGYIFLNESGSPVKSAWFSTQLKHLLVAAGFSPDTYAPHSLRIGATTDLVEKGVPVEKIRAFGRWKTNTHVKYVRPDVIVV